MSKSLDERIKETIKEDFENTPSSPLSKDEAWEQIQGRLTGEPVESKKSGVRRYAKLITVAASLVVILFGLFLFQSQNGSAFGWITKYFTETDGDTTQLKQSITEPESKDQPPVPDLSDIQGHNEEISKKTMDLSKAKSTTNFPIAVPEKIPSGFTLQNVTVWLQADNEKSNEVRLNYAKGKESFSIQEEHFEGNMGSTIGVDNEDTSVKKVNINGQSGTLFIFKDGLKRLIWTRMKTRFVINSNSPSLSESTIISIAQSMQ